MTQEPDARRGVPMATGNREGRVPRELRDEVAGLQATDDNDVAGEFEDDNPLHHVGDLVDGGEPR